MLTLEPCEVVGWDIYFVSIDAGAQVAIILLIFIHIWTLCGHCKLVGTGLYLGRAPRTKETLPDFRE